LELQRAIEASLSLAGENTRRKKKAMDEAKSMLRGMNLRVQHNPKDDGACFFNAVEASLKHNIRIQTEKKRLGPDDLKGFGTQQALLEAIREILLEDEWYTFKETTMKCANLNELIEVVMLHVDMLPDLKSFIFDRQAWELCRHFQDFVSQVLFRAAEEVGIDYVQMRNWIQSYDWTKDLPNQLPENEVDFELLSTRPPWLQYGTSEAKTDPDDQKLDLLRGILCKRYPWTNMMTEDALAYLLYCALSNSPTQYNHVSNIGDTIPLIMASWLNIPIMILNKERKKNKLNNFSVIEPSLAPSKAELDDGPPTRLSDLLKSVSGLLTKMKPAFAGNHPFSHYWTAVSTLRIPEPTEHIISIASMNANITAGQTFNYMNKHSRVAPPSPVVIRKTRQASTTSSP
jgi:hypothetical protein